MDVTTLKHDARKVLDKIHTAEDGKVSISKGDLKIMFPKHYVNGKLGHIDSRFNVVGMYAIILDDKYYAVSLANAVMPLVPDEINVTVVDQAEYYVLGFPAGSVICPDLDLVKNNQLIYQIDYDIGSLGKTPWYLNTELMCRMFDTAKEYADVDLMASPAILDITIASRARDPENLLHYRKEDYKTQADFGKLKVTFVPQKAVAFTATNTSARLLGPWLPDGIMSAMVQPSVENELIEDILRA